MKILKWFFGILLTLILLLFIIFLLGPKPPTPDLIIRAATASSDLNFLADSIEKAENVSVVVLEGVLRKVPAGYVEQGSTVGGRIIWAIVGSGTWGADARYVGVGDVRDVDGRVVIGSRIVTVTLSGGG